MELNSKERWNKAYDDFPMTRSLWRGSHSGFLGKELSSLPKKGAILDAGCGDGRNLLFLAEKGFNVTGVDFSFSALKRCKALLEKRKLSAKLIEVDLKSLPLENNSFDAVLCDSVFPHILKSKSVISEFYRVLKAGGSLLLETLADSDPSFGKGRAIGEKTFESNGIATIYYSKNELEILLSEFKIAGIETLKYSDPAHGTTYARSAPHKHESWLVIAKK